MRFSSSNLESRISCFQEIVKTLRLNGVIVSGPDNLFYFSDHLIGEGNGPSLLFIPVSGVPILVIPEGETALSDVQHFSGELVPYTCTGQDSHDLPAPVQALRNCYAEKINPPLGIEADFLSYRGAGVLGLGSDSNFVDITGEIRNLRMIKSREEIELLKSAARIADTGQAEAEMIYREGVDEITLQALTRAAMEKSAGLPIECKADVLFGKSTALIGSPDGVAGQRKAKRGDPAIIDLLPRVKGYFADTTRTLWIEPVPSRVKKVVRLLHELKGKLERLLKPGVKIHEIDDTARAILTREGSFPHHTGHGIGISSYEAPYICPGAEGVLKEGMVITLEPGLYFDNWGARIEDDYMITADGFERLSGSGGS